MRVDNPLKHIYKKSDSSGFTVEFTQGGTKLYLGIYKRLDIAKEVRDHYLATGERLILSYDGTLRKPTEIEKREFEYKSKNKISANTIDLIYKKAKTLTLAQLKELTNRFIRLYNQRNETDDNEKS